MENNVVSKMVMLSFDFGSVYEHFVNIKSGHRESKKKAPHEHLIPGYVCKVCLILH